MTYETMDWKAEAIRVAGAFGVEGEVRWVISNASKRDVFRALRSTEHNDFTGRFNILSVDGIDVHAEYDLDIIAYSLRGNGACEIRLWYDGTVEQAPRHYFQHNQLLAKALYHLSLLTPAVEEALQVSISAHQKLEWALEYEARMAMK